MKKKLRFILCLLLSIATFFSFITIASAEYLGTGKISGGANNILYWRDSSIYEYRDSVDQGFAYWNGHVSNVSLARTNTKSYSRCDVYWGDYFPVGAQILAQTFLKLNNQTTENYNQDWYWCEVKFNMYLYNYTGVPSFAERKGTACHEYGHFLGLAHPVNTWDKYTIMAQTGPRQVQVPQTDDYNDVAARYN
jgi:hypothetical protein